MATRSRCCPRPVSRRDSPARSRMRPAACVSFPAADSPWAGHDGDRTHAGAPHRPGADASASCLGDRSRVSRSPAGRDVSTEAGRARGVAGAGRRADALGAPAASHRDLRGGHRFRRGLLFPRPVLRQELCLAGQRGPASLRATSNRAGGAGWPGRESVRLRYWRDILLAPAGFDHPAPGDFRGRRVSALGPV